MRILIYGAGSTGCYLAARCIQAGCEVTVIGRERIRNELLTQGKIQVSDFDGKLFSTEPPAFKTHLDQLDLTSHSFDLCLVSLKCHHLELAKNDLAEISRSGAELHFLQNGINAYRAIPALSQLQHTQSGIIPFNVLAQGQARFHQGTEGNLQLSTTANTRKLAQAFQHAGLAIELHDNMQAVIYGKLLLNLNNAINAVSNIPLKTQLEDRALRKQLADAMQEYLALCIRLKLPLSSPSPIPPRLLPYLLKLPNFIFTRVAKKLLTIDPLARSSMWEDIQAGRKTEIEYLNGWVVKACEKTGIPCPVNTAITLKIKELETT